MGKKKTKEPEGPAKDELNPLDIVMKKPQSVVLMLASHEDHVLQASCEALYKFAEKCEENKVQLMELGALDPLLKLICHEEKTIKRNAVMCLGTLTSNINIRKLVRNAGAIPSIIALLSPEEDVICHEFGSLALAYLAEEYISKVEIFEQGGLEPLINLLSSYDCDVQKNAAHAVSLLLQDFQTRAAINDLNGIEPLLKLIDSDYPVIQEIALTALIRCSHDMDSRTAIRELNGLAKLVDVIGKKDWSDLHVACLQVLSNCLEDQENLQAIQTTGVFDKLLAFIAESTTPEVQQFAADVISAAARNEQSRKVFNEQETEKTLITLLSSDNPAVCTAAAKAIGTMSESLNSRDLVGRLEGISALITLLKNDSQEMHEAVTLALANLTCDNANNCSDLVDSGGVEPVIHMLMDNKATVQANAASCLNNLALHENLRETIFRAGAISYLVSALQSSDKDVQSKTLQAVASFLCDSAARNEFRSEGGLPILAELLSSNSETVRRNACWVVMLCCNDTILAQDLTTLGALRTLQDINQSSSRQTTFSSTALDRILDNNLPAKYSLTGELSPHNLVVDGFYDTGKRLPSTDFPTLEELSRPLDENPTAMQLRPVLLINASGEDLRNKEISEPIFRSSTDRINEKPKSKTKLTQRSSPIKTDIRSKDEATVKQPVISSPVNISGRRKTSWVAPTDNVFTTYVEHARNTISPLETSREQVDALARFVSDKMGGPVLKEPSSSLSHELPTTEIMNELNSRVIPIGMIKKGIYYHRALLFKALADRIALRCSLIRGDYGRAWNEVYLTQNDEVTGTESPPIPFIVDLMHNIGKLMAPSDPEAILYQRL